VTGKIGLLNACCRILGVTLCVACNGSSQTLGGPAPGPSPAAADFSILVFSKTAGFRHDSIPAGISAIRQQGGSRGFLVEATEDAGVFADDSLGKYKVVVFLSTTGDVLNPAQEAAFERFIRRGGGFVGVHAAADTEYDWPFYGGLVGAYFAGHPAVQSAAIEIEDASHPATASLPRTWTRRDEWYNFRRNPRGSVAVLATLDERSYSGGTMAPDHPIVWAHSYEGGRAFYTGLGHTQESFSEAAFVDHLGRAILWAAAAI
jgi:type 1 glutamine amidotransferase